MHESISGCSARSESEPHLNQTVSSLNTLKTVRHRNSFKKDAGFTSQYRQWTTLPLIPTGFNRIQSMVAPTICIFEMTMTAHYNTIGRLVLEYTPIAAIPQLRRCSSVLDAVVRSYCFTRWHTTVLQEKYFSKGSVRRRLKEASAVMFGIAVLNFLDRCHSPYDVLDIAIRFEKMTYMCDFLQQEEYVLQGADGREITTIVEDLMRGLPPSHSMGSAVYDHSYLDYPILHFRRSPFRYPGSSRLIRLHISKRSALKPVLAQSTSTLSPVFG